MGHRSKKKAGHVRGYRAMGQRRMTNFDEDSNDAAQAAEMDRLRTVIRTTSAVAHLPTANGSDFIVDDDATNNSTSKKRPRRPVAASSEANADAHSGILSAELLAEMDGIDPSDLVVMGGAKKKKLKPSPAVDLTPSERKQAKQAHKNAVRKLQQLEKRAAQKETRTVLYDQLQALQVASSAAQPLLQSSATLGQRRSVKQELAHLLRKQRAGITLTTPEQSLLYRDRETVTAPDVPGVESSAQHPGGDVAAPTMRLGSATRADTSTGADVPPSNDGQNSQSPATFKPTGIAAQMRASLQSLQNTVAQQQNATAPAQRKEPAQQKQQHERHGASKKYVPREMPALTTAPAVLAERMGLPVAAPPQQPKVRDVLQINRPAAIQAARLELPVVGMEFEIMDAIRNHNVTIVCSETGSGKSTQVPQMLYEANYGPIAITQPRRVAAVSTAKRVCFEMGAGDGQSIVATRDHGGGGGNIVAYQTRYETAGLGPATHVLFMTDGILLREIQQDLLLRKYNAVILDEAHERNLNTDVLIGLLSLAIPLRRTAAAEEGAQIKPLKLIIMSATLRVEDFTRNERLFTSMPPPAVVKIPGRAFPVTVHHSKSTELDDYELHTYHKVCKMHRKLPKGGILLFLTGKQEIMRTVQRLRRSLDPACPRDLYRTAVDDVRLAADETALRDLDDDEIDGELLIGDNKAGEPSNKTEFVAGGADDIAPASDDDRRPTKVRILPLYSMMATEEQAKVFADVPEDVRLIVVATNVAETSITIPNIAYVVDCGRQKCKTYHAETGVASYNVMWISKAAADQRAGRAGRTGPGHCYRLYSSSMYERHMDAFSLPEVLCRPLEDVVLAMKAMNVGNISAFPFPTPPDRKQVAAAVELLANLGCVDLSRTELDGGDGAITKLGAAVAQLPLGVRYGKMLLVAADLGVLDYALAVVAALGEVSPFERPGATAESPAELDIENKDNVNDIKNGTDQANSQSWHHKGGDALALLSAVGAYAYASRGARGASEQLACERFCHNNGLNYVIMARIHRQRMHLARLAHARFGSVESIAAKTGGFLPSMRPPDKTQERLLMQAITSGLLDQVATLVPYGARSDSSSFRLRSVFKSCTLGDNEILLIDDGSVLYNRDFRQLPRCVCFEALVRKTLKDGTTVAKMKNVTPIEASWLGGLAKHSKLLVLGEPLPMPLPVYDAQRDAILCNVSTKFGTQGWEIPSVQRDMAEALAEQTHKSAHFEADDVFRWFARFLLEGKVFSELAPLAEMLNDSPAIITRRLPQSKVTLLVADLADAKITSAATLVEHWALRNDKLLFRRLKHWVRRDRTDDAMALWIDLVQRKIARTTKPAS